MPPKTTVRLGSVLIHLSMLAMLSVTIPSQKRISLSAPTQPVQESLPKKLNPGAPETMWDSKTLGWGRGLPIPLLGPGRKVRNWLGGGALELLCGVDAALSWAGERERTFLSQYPRKMK